MHPGTDDEGVEDTGIVFLDGVIGAERAGEIFGIEPAPDGENGAFDPVHVLGEIARLPEAVLGGVLVLVVVEGVLDRGGDVGEVGAVLEKVVVCVGDAEFEGVEKLGGREFGAVGTGWKKVE